jgi:hypothetical protein
MYQVGSVRVTSPCAVRTLHFRVRNAQNVALQFFIPHVCLYICDTVWMFL